MAIEVNPVLEAANRSDYAFKNIPVIDMKDADIDQPEIRKRLSEQVRDACMNVGFFYVKNHGILEEIIDSAVESGKEFFKLPETTKLKYDVTKLQGFKGYNALLSENNDPENRGDLHEGYNIGPESTGSSSAGAELGSNVWPEEVPTFRDGVMAYYDAVVAFGRKLFPLFALALDLPEDWFADKTQEAAAIMRVLHYPPQTGPHDDRILGIGAHTDFECFTILWQQSDIQALQVLNADKEWVNATPIPGTLVINIGDQLARWTNDVFKSTVHRAINRTGVERYSMPLFFGVDYGVMLEPIPSCVSEDRPAKYEVISAGEFVKSRLEDAYGSTKK